MTTSQKFSSIQFPLLISLPFILVLMLVAFFFGCQQKDSEEKEKKSTATIENLQTAYGKSIMRQRLYTQFAKRAEEERLTNVAKLFRAAARSEEIHAALHADLLRKNGVEPTTPDKDSVAIGTTLQTLKMSISNEQLEAESMYPNLIRTADLENFSEAVDQFKKVKDADARHLELFKDAYDRGGRIQRAPYLVCPMCGYILTSEKTEKCPVCQTQKQQFEKL